MQKTGDSILKSKQHFDILDGLRGIAALAVVIFHFMEMAYTDYGKNFIGHGFLAVDFFFCLSGFVIGYAYDDRIKKMGVKEFFKSRLIRLHPLVISGSVLGLISFLFDPFGGHPELYGAGQVVLIFLTSILVIPYPVITERSFNLFGINAPAWSLFWEYVANIVYAFILCRISRGFLIVLTVIAAVVLAYTSYNAGSLMGGWGKPNFWDGAARIFYSFSAGLLIYRSNWIVKNKLGCAGVAVLLAAAFVMPWSQQWNWLTELLVVLFYFPLLISLGAGATLSQGFRKIFVFSGKISYPLYMTHYAVIWMFLNYYSTHTVSTLQLFFIITIGTICLIVLSWVVMTIYDMPVRKYFTYKRKKLNIQNNSQ